MKVSQRLDTPFKRIGFIALIIGAMTLAASLVVWLQQSRYHRIFYSEDHYRWLPVSQSFTGPMERYWSWDRDCIKPLARDRIAHLQQELEAHRGSRPEDTNLKKNNLDWLMRGMSIETEVEIAGNRLATIGDQSIREGAIRRSLSSAISGKDTRTEDEKFRESLYDRLGLTWFPVEERDTIFESCVQETALGKKRVRTSYHSDLDDWPGDHPIPYWFGLFLTISGFLGSFGYKMSSLVIRGTAGRLLSWVKTGGRKPAAKPDSISGAPSPAQMVATVEQIEEEVVGDAPAGEKRNGLSRFMSNVVIPFGPHLAILGGMPAVLGLGVATNDPALVRTTAGAIASAVDPIILIPAVAMGFAIRRHKILIPSLIALGLSISAFVSQMNFSLGLTAESIIGKVVAALVVGYLANLLMIIKKRNLAGGGIALF